MSELIPLKVCSFTLLAALEFWTRNCVVVFFFRKKGKKLFMPYAYFLFYHQSQFHVHVICNILQCILYLFGHKTVCPLLNAPK